MKKEKCTYQNPYLLNMWYPDLGLPCIGYMEIIMALYINVQCLFRKTLAK